MHHVTPFLVLLRGWKTLLSWKPLWTFSPPLPPLQVLLRGGEPLGLAFFHAEPLAMKGFDQEDLDLFNEVGREGGREERRG